MTATCIQYLKPGTKFRLACEPNLTGTLVTCTGCSATVRLHGGVRDVEFEDHDGQPRHFRAASGRTTTWALATLVEPILYPEDDQSSLHEENAMSTKTATKKTGTKKATKAKGDKRTGVAPQSQLDLDETKKLESARAKKAKTAGKATKAKAKFPDTPKTQISVALDFLKERGCVVIRGRRSYPASSFVYEDAMIEYYALDA